MGAVDCTQDRCVGHAVLSRAELELTDAGFDPESSQDSIALRELGAEHLLFGESCIVTGPASRLGRHSVMHGGEGECAVP
jgi:hypothetical protein